MLELPANQAAGLMGLATLAGPQMVSLVSHGDDQTELPLLWQLCCAWSELGYAVTVLDATQAESAAQPGLEQMMEYRLAGSYEPPGVEADATQWTIVPCAKGIQSLLHPGSSNWQALARVGQLFAAETVVILYAGVDCLVRLLGHTAVKPLLSVSEDKTSLLTSYLALKRLLVQGRLEPTILNMISAGGSNLAVRGKVSAHLGECARKFLGYELKAIDLDLTLEGPSHGARVRRLAARMLESSLTLGNAGTRGYGAMGRSLNAMGRTH